MIRAVVLTVGSTFLAFALSGCATTREHRHDLDRYGFVFYLDGAGGGNAIKDYGRCVEAGLRQAGFQGDFYSFPWHTGLGVAADQASSVDYKRSKARELARTIFQYVDEHPGTPVTIIGLSAGTAVAIFALEEIPSRYRVDSVVLMGSSVSAHYDLSKALKRIDGKLTVYTSDKDAVLGILVPISGTADRKPCGGCSAGLHGFHLPENANAESKDLYDSKLSNVSWDPAFAAAENFGGHTDAVNENFVREYVAPIVLRDESKVTTAALEPRY